jgi:two-component system sensor histidine kinase DesK
VRGLATSALTELREVVHGYRQVDLREQLTAIERVLESSGVHCTVQAPDGVLPPPVAAPLAAVLREASTNVLRHSRAAWCTIDIVRAGPEFMMTVVNDGAGDAAPDRHSHGLHGLAERLAESGGVLRTRAADGRFTVEAVVRSAP